MLENYFWNHISQPIRLFEFLLIIFGPLELLDIRIETVEEDFECVDSFQFRELESGLPNCFDNDILVGHLLILQWG